MYYYIGKGKAKGVSIKTRPCVAGPCFYEGGWNRRKSKIQLPKQQSIPIFLLRRSKWKWAE